MKSGHSLHWLPTVGLDARHDQGRLFLLGVEGDP